jgi:hypothetical protein
MNGVTISERRAASTAAVRHQHRLYLDARACGLRDLARRRLRRLHELRQELAHLDPAGKGPGCPVAGRSPGG